jgi:uncharacterized protein (TIGR00266 family)
MKFDVIAQGSYPGLQATLDPGDKMVAEAGAMAWMDDCIEVSTSARGGVLAGLKRSVLGGESFFQNEFTSTRPGGQIVLVSGQPGDIKEMDMAGQDILLEKGAYLASTPDVKVDSKFQGLKGLFAEGMFVLQASGNGKLFYSSYGDIREVQVEGEYVVDNGYAVAWDSTLSYQIRKSGKKIRAFLFSDQLVMHFSGRGRIWVQSRSPSSLASWIYPFRRVRPKSNE